ncbi:MAG: hypothetical protein KDI68_12700 [Gammaproteobacteria bacterium]|nr:hypothetical protein [Gammaproteobacteria bacterium]
MNKLLTALALVLTLAACSDENMEKWKEMNKDRIEGAPKENPNLPSVKGDVEAVKKTLRDINDAVHDKVDNMLEKQQEK